MLMTTFVAVVFRAQGRGVGGVQMAAEAPGFPVEAGDVRLGLRAGEPGHLPLGRRRCGVEDVSPAGLQAAFAGRVCITPC